MPPRVREVVRILERHGWVLARCGRGDHRVFKKDGASESIVISGSDHRELKKGAWEEVRKRLRLEE
jgi:predicted RNA binding protein YcfA (HicA-like mRNA interferase family)